MDSVAEVGGRLHLRSLFRRLGPGFITGAADDDPSGIATYSQAGAQAGVGLLWTVVLTWPMMVAVQSLCARVGRVTGHGLAGNMVRIFPRPVVYVLVGMLLAANTINIGADLAAMGAAIQLVVGGPGHIYTFVLAVASLLAVVFVPYHRYVGVLKWLTFSLFAYVGVVFTVHIDWRAVAVGALLPRFALNNETITLIVAIFGTTISPYLFFWQSSQEVEDEEADPEAGPLIDHPEQASRELNRIGWETWLGMAFSNLVAFFIILTTAVTLHAAGKTDIQTSAQAAEALRPVAGEFAFLVFGLGIVGTGLLAVPVLAGSAAYAVSELFGWKAGLSRGFHEARGFYSIIIAATGIGSAMGYFEIDPIKALVLSAIVNGVISVPIMVVMMMIGQSKPLMGRFTISTRHRLFGWAATAVMAAAVAVMFLTAL